MLNLCIENVNNFCAYLSDVKGKISFDGNASKLFFLPLSYRHKLLNRVEKILCKSQTCCNNILKTNTALKRTFKQLSSE